MKILKSFVPPVVQAISGELKLQASKNLVSCSGRLASKAVQTLAKYEKRKRALDIIASKSRFLQFTPEVDDEVLAQAVVDAEVEIDPVALGTAFFALQQGGVGIVSAHVGEKGLLIPDSERKGLVMFSERVVERSHRALVEDSPDKTWGSVLGKVKYLFGQGLPSVVVGTYPHVLKDFGEVFTELQKKEGITVGPEAWFYSFSPIPAVSIFTESIAQEFSASPNLFMIGNHVGQILAGQDDPPIRLAREQAYLRVFGNTREGRDFRELQNLRSMGDPEIVRKLDYARAEGRMVVETLVEPDIKREILRIKSSM